MKCFVHNMALEIEDIIIRNKIEFCFLRSYISSFVCGQCTLGWDDGPISTSICSLEDVAIRHLRKLSV